MEESKCVGIRELRQNLSRYLRKVALGESFRVSDRGTPVALLGPLPERATPLERLRAEGSVLAARRKLTDLGEPPLRRSDISISQALAEMRAEG
jgi:prevent-host-death family protein